MNLKKIFPKASDLLINFFESYSKTNNEYSSISIISITYDDFIELKTNEYYNKMKEFIDNYNINEIKATIINKAKNGDINAAKYYDSSIDTIEEDIDIIDIMKKLRVKNNE